MRSSRQRYLWSRQGVRFQWQKAHPGRALNWLFLPGGPGLGSESLQSLIECLMLPGTLWSIDLPGDGSNTTTNNTESFKQWPEALLEGVEALGQVVLVGHSSGGMYALSLPELEEKLVGLVLIDSAPDAGWQRELKKMFQERPLEEAEKLTKRYEQQPGNQALRDLTVACASYFFSEKALEQGRALLASLPYNYESFAWSAKHFDDTYQALWVPKKLPTLILAGSHDRLTPLAAFKEKRDFQRPNILMREIAGGGHFPWIEKPNEVGRVFEEYALTLEKSA